MVGQNDYIVAKFGALLGGVYAYTMARNQRMNGLDHEGAKKGGVSMCNAGVAFVIYVVYFLTLALGPFRDHIDDNSAPAAGNVKVRVVHTAPFAATSEATEVSIRTAGGDLVAGLQGVPYEAATGYLELPAGTYDLKVASNNGQVNYIDPLPVDLPAGAVATLFAVGDIVNQDLGIIATPLTELPLRAPVDDSTNGAYALDGLDGQGFWFTPIPAQNRAVGAWYTYGADGTPIWFTFESEPGGFDGMHAMTTLYQSTGPTMSDMQMTEPVGTIEFDVIDCSLMETLVTIGDSVTLIDGLRLTPSASCPPQN
mgnify:CR=1 FL=1